MSDEIKAEVIIGDDAESFVASELGRTVLGMAEQDLKAAIIAFDEVDLANREKLGQIQLEVRLARRFEKYLNELIYRGREALEAYRQQQES